MIAVQNRGLARVAPHPADITEAWATEVVRLCDGEVVEEAKTLRIAEVPLAEALSLVVGLAR